ncbi:MAG TPA: AraC family transcriptional regulator [Microlunatus sp.]|nr:AraC family transcriptional regulator [Microlunatus sp.]
MDEAADFRDPGCWGRIEGLLTRTPPVPSGSADVHHCGPDWSWQPRIADFDLWLVFDGRGHGRLNDRLELTLRPGSLLVLRPGDRGSIGHDPAQPLSVLSCHFCFRDPTDGQRVDPAFALLPRRFLQLPAPGPLTGAFRQLVRAVHDPSPLRGLDARARLLEVLAEIYRQDALDQGVAAGTLSPQLADAIDLIRAKPEQRHSLAGTAAAVGLTTRQLSGMFSRQLHTTFREYLVESRLDRGRSLLAETSMSIHQIARALGYSDPFLFSRQFRSRYGLPPSHYRDAIQRP